MFLGCKILILLKSNQICPNFAQKRFRMGCGCIPTSYDTGGGGGATRPLPRDGDAEEFRGTQYSLI